MKNPHILFAAALVTGLGFGLPARAEPPPWAPAHGYRAKQAPAHRYVYYPQQRVYYAPETHSWFWLNGGNWQVGVTLPSQYRAYVSNGGVSISLNTSRPYVQHVYVEENYGRPWRAKHKHQQRQHEEFRHNDPRRNGGDHGRRNDKFDQHDGERGHGHGHGHGHGR